MDQRLTTIKTKAAEKEHSSGLSQLMADIVAFERRHKTAIRATVYRLLIVGALLPAAGLALVGFLREGSAAQTLSHRPPLDFRLVEKRYGDVGLFNTREQVEELLGPPTQRAVWEPNFWQLMERVEHSNRHFGVPSNQVWVRWTDPKHEDKSVTILFAGDKVYYKFKKGF